MSAEVISLGSQPKVWSVRPSVSSLWALWTHQFLLSAFKWIDPIMSIKQQDTPAFIKCFWNNFWGLVSEADWSTFSSLVSISSSRVVEPMQTEFITSLTECKQRRQPPGLAAVANCTKLYSQETLKEQFTQKCTQVQSPKLWVTSRSGAGSRKLLRPHPLFLSHSSGI